MPDTESEDYTDEEDNDTVHRQHVYNEMKVTLIEDENMRLQSNRSGNINIYQPKSQTTTQEGQKKYGSVSSGILNRVLGENNSSRVLALKPDDSL